MADPSNLGIPVYQFHAEPPESKTLVYNYKTTQDVDPGWTLDGFAFNAFPSPQSGVVPVYQFYNDTSGYWKNMLSLSTGQGTGWKLIGIPFYAYANNKSQCGLAVYQFSTDDLRFYYTTNDSGSFGPGWNFNGALFYLAWYPQAS
jgi:hypothetical protein